MTNLQTGLYVWMHVCVLVREIATTHGQSATVLSVFAFGYGPPPLLCQ